MAGTMVTCGTIIERNSQKGNNSRSQTWKLMREQNSPRTPHLKTPQKTKTRSGTMGRRPRNILKLRPPARI